MKFAIAVLSTLCFAYVQAQNAMEMMLLSQMLGRGGSSSSGGNALTSSTSSNPLGLTGSSGGGSNPLSSLTSSSGSSNPLSSLMGGGMGRMAGGMMLGGADMSAMMGLYTCGRTNLPLFLCMTIMQQNM